MSEPLSTREQEAMDRAKKPCPVWSDGEHCYREAVSGDTVLFKQCLCGALVLKVPRAREDRQFV